MKTYSRLMNLTDMRAFGRQIGGNVRGGEVFELIGDMGAGKTTLTKAIAQGMGINEPVQSPTFTLSNRYEAPEGIELTHYDFYRLEDAGIMRDELHESVTSPLTVTVIEWSNVVQDVLPEDRVIIAIRTISETMREVIVQAGGPRSEEVLEYMA